MPLTFYCGAGSPYAWRVWLALEHKRLDYELRMLSFSEGDLKTAEYLKLNPRGRVPAIVDGGFALYESAAIVEYLEDAYPAYGASLFPADARARAVVRRIIREADEYLAHAMEALVSAILFTPPEKWDDAAIGEARGAYVAELARLSPAAGEAFFNGNEPGAADFTVYPLIALALRMEKRRPDLRVRAALPATLSSWMKRVEALPFYDTTYPPHWKQR